MSDVPHHVENENQERESTALARNFGKPNIASARDILAVPTQLVSHASVTQISLCDAVVRFNRLLLRTRQKSNGIYTCGTVFKTLRPQTRTESGTSIVESGQAEST